MQLTVIGPGCARCKTLAQLTEQAAKELGVQYELNKVTDHGAGRYDDARPGRKRYRQVGGPRAVARGDQEAARLKPEMRTQVKDRS